MTDKIDVKNISVDVQLHKPDPKQSNRYPSRDRIYVRAVKGLHQMLRRYMGFFFMGLFMLLPWLRYNGEQAILLDIAEQKFTIFALTLWPQDFTILAWLFIIAAYALFFVTTFYGRVWCGYLCPQSVWTFIFMWFEEKIQGSRNQRMKLDQQPWSVSKFSKKFLTHVCWVAVALLTSLVFVGYFTPIDQLVLNFFTIQAGFWATVAVLFFTFCTYGNAGWMREIMCTHMCPYARFQSAMFDKDTFTVSYNTERGESRGPRSRKDKEYKEKGLGDCIDCNLCVHVCPTGIDIRNGLQYECINCGACIDACDDTMEKMGYPKGLISYTTESRLQGKQTHIFRPKLVGYFAVLVVVCMAFAYTLHQRQPLEFDIIRDRGALFRDTSEGWVENTYILRIINKSQHERSYVIDYSGLDNARWIGPQQVTVAGGETISQPVSLAADPWELAETITDVLFTVTVLEQPDIQASQTNRFFSRR